MGVDFYVCSGGYSLSLEKMSGQQNDGRFCDECAKDVRLDVPCIDGSFIVALEWKRPSTKFIHIHGDKCGTKFEPINEFFNSFYFECRELDYHQSSGNRAQYWLEAPDLDPLSPRQKLEKKRSELENLVVSKAEEENLMFRSWLVLPSTLPLTLNRKRKFLSTSDDTNNRNANIHEDESKNDEGQLNKS